MHDNILAALAALKVVMSGSSSIGSSVSRLICYKDFQWVLYNSKTCNSKIVL